MKHPRILASLILVGLTLSQPFAAPMPLEALNDTTAYHDLKGLYAKAQHYFKQNKFDSAALYFDDANQLANENAFTDEKLIHEIKNGYGITLAYLRQNMKSIEIFKELNSFYRENNSEGKYNKELAKTFNNIAINYNFIFDLEQAVRYFDSSLVYFRKENLLFADETRRAHYNKALNFLDMGNYQAAIENVELARFNRVKDSGDDKLSYERMSENLIFSEVLIEMNQGPHELREALTYLNMIRQRAGINAKTSITWEDIFHERILEFAMEGQAWYEFIRLHYYDPNKAYQILSEQDRGTFRIYPDRIPDPRMWEIEIPDSDTSPRFFNVNSNNFKIPIPSAELSRAPNLRKPPVAYDFSNQ